MKKISIFLVLLIFLLPLQSYAQLVEINSFKAMPAEVILDGKDYIGILLDEDEYTRYTQMEIDIPHLKIENELLKSGMEKLQISYDKLLDANLGIIDKIVELSKKTWFDENKGWIALGIGFIVGAVTVGAVVSLSK